MGASGFPPPCLLFSAEPYKLCSFSMGTAWLGRTLNAAVGGTPLPASQVAGWSLATRRYSKSSRPKAGPLAEERRCRLRYFAQANVVGVSRPVDWNTEGLGARWEFLCPGQPDCERARDEVKDG